MSLLQLVTAVESVESELRAQVQVLTEMLRGAYGDRPAGP